MSFGRTFTVAALLLGAATSFGGCKSKPSSSQAANTWAPSNTWKDDRGEVQCPVCGTEVPNQSATCGHEEFDGKEYFFCCEQCQHSFHDAPASFADGRALKKDDCAAPSGDPTSGVCK